MYAPAAHLHLSAGDVARCRVGSERGNGSMSFPLPAIWRVAAEATRTRVLVNVPRPLHKSPRVELMFEADIDHNVWIDYIYS